ncbi:MAG: glycosyltransferase [Actinomycetota bacterium]|nr:glycosyltransferase [Actinomycetota bacterium]
MRILVVTNLWPTQGRPGFGVFVAARVRALRADGHEVTVIGPGSGPPWRRYLRLAGRVAKVMVAARGRRQVDIVEAHIAYPTGVLARPVAAAVRSPLVLFAHGSDVMSLPERSRLDGFLARGVLRRADLVVTNGPYLSAELHGLIGAPRRLAEISPGIDLSLFAAGRGEPHVPLELLFVGHLVSHKGPATLLQALASRSAAHRFSVTFCGAGPQRGHLEDLARQLRLAVTWRGEVPLAEVAATMARADILVVPSIREALGLVALEGMAAGCVVVASRTGGLAVTVRDGENGLLAEPGDPADLARVINRAVDLIEHRPEELRRLRAHARRTAEAHSAQAGARATVAHFERLLEGRSTVAL